MAELAAPLVFENRVTYRLSEAELSGSPRLAFTTGRYFDGVDIGEAAAHEYAAARLGVPAPGVSTGGLRGRFADPCDLRQQPGQPGHRRADPATGPQGGPGVVPAALAGPGQGGSRRRGLYQVIQVGIFQPSGEAAWNRRNDFSLWRCMIREFAEELGGRSEDYGSESGPVDYESWPFARQLTDALDRGQIRAWCLGLGTTADLRHRPAHRGGD